MKKFIFIASLVGLMALVPALFVGYLHDNSKTDKDDSAIIVKDGKSNDEGMILRLVKTF